MALKQIDQARISYNDLREQGYVEPLVHPLLNRATIPPRLSEDYRQLKEAGAVAEAVSRESASDEINDEVLKTAGRLASSYVIDGTTGMVLTPDEAAMYARGVEAADIPR